MRGCGGHLIHCENAGRIYRPIGVYAGLSYKLADLRICTRASGARPNTDLSCRLYGAINQSIVYYVYRSYGLGGFVWLYIWTVWAEIQENNTHEVKML